MRRTAVTSAGAVVATALALVAAGAVPVAASPPAPSAPAATPSVSADTTVRGAVEAAAGAAVARLAPVTTSQAPRSALRADTVRPLGGGDRVVRFQQMTDGVPVYAGELAVQVAADDTVLSVTGETADVPRRIGWSVGTEAARTTALRVARGREGARGVVLTPSAATAYVYDPVLVGEPDTGPRPVWQVVVSGPPASGVTVEVLVDAGTGAVAETIDRTQHVLRRTICDNENSTTSNLAAGSWCTPSDYNGYFLTQIDGSRPQAARAYNDLRDVSDFYADVLSVDLTQLVGLDTARPYRQRSTPALTATVNYCESGEQCPYVNAFWVDADPRFVPGNGRVYPGGQVYLGQGLADSEDVVAHEVTHGVTSAVSALKYLNQSGAINESMSDVFGQLSQLYDHGTRTFYNARDPRWLIGEHLDVPGLRGAVRSMSNPATTSLSAGDPQPDRMRSKYWATGRADSGGVHTNNGVGNKTAYLIAVGGKFNGVRIKGISHRLTARLYWRAQNLLTSGASYRDLAIALSVACNGLYGRGSAACASVRKATAATQISRSKVTISLASSSVRYGKKRAVRARLVNYRGGGLYVRSSQGVRLILERRYVGAKKWKRISAKRVSTAGRATWSLSPKRKAVYRVRYAGSATYGLRPASKSRTISVRR